MGLMTELGPANICAAAGRRPGWRLRWCQCSRRHWKRRTWDSLEMLAPRSCTGRRPRLGRVSAKCRCKGYCPTRTRLATSDRPVDHRGQLDPPCHSNRLPIQANREPVEAGRLRQSCHECDTTSSSPFVCSGLARLRPQGLVDLHWCRGPARPRKVSQN